MTFIKWGLNDKDLSHLVTKQWKTEDQGSKHNGYESERQEGMKAAGLRPKNPWVWKKWKADTGQ